MPVRKRGSVHANGRQRLAAPAAVAMLAVAVAAVAAAAASSLAGDALAQGMEPGGAAQGETSLGRMMVNLVAPSTDSTTSMMMATIVVPTTPEVAEPTVVVPPAPQSGLFASGGGSGGGGGGGGGGGRVMSGGAGAVVLYGASWDCGEGTIQVTTNAGIDPEISIVSSAGTVAAMMSDGPHPAGRTVYEAPLPADSVVSIRAAFADGRALSTASETVRTGGQCEGEAIFVQYGAADERPMQEQMPADMPGDGGAAAAPGQDDDADAPAEADEMAPADDDAADEMAPADDDAADEMAPADDDAADEMAPADDDAADEMAPADDDAADEMAPAVTDDAAPTAEDDGSGGCLIATAAHGTELASQVQSLREVRDGTLMTTEAGRAFMSAFGTVYYSFSPQVADLEREHPALRQAVAALAAPMLLALQVVDAAEPGSEGSVVAYGALAIALVAGMYVAAPAAGAWYAVRLGRARSTTS